MRLTCPRCAAQYEIAESAIPASGREVECSACSHVWRQPGPGKSAPSPAAPERGPYDPEARPALNRPLDESVLAILREEAARELGARRSEAQPAEPDHIPATQAAEAPPAVPPDVPADAAQPAEPALSGDGEPAAGPAIDWPATTVTEAPLAEPAPARPEAEPPAGIGAASQPAADPVPQPEAGDPQALHPSPRPEPVSAPAGDSSAFDQPEPIIPILPDAQELAATLTRSAPSLPGGAAGAAAEEPPVLPLLRPAAAEEAAPADTGGEPAPREAPVPVIVPRPRRTGYASGFGLAAMLALGLVASYALAPQIPADEGGGPLAEWRQQIDRGRLWLHDRIRGE